MRCCICREDRECPSRTFNGAGICEECKESMKAALAREAYIQKKEKENEK